MVVTSGGQKKISMNNDCIIEFFGLEMFVDKHDCDNCPFKDSSECLKALPKILKEANDNYLNYLQAMNRKTRRSLSNKEKENIYNIYKREAIKKFLSEKGIILKYTPKCSSTSANDITEKEYKQKLIMTLDDDNIALEIYIRSVVNICKAYINSYMGCESCRFEFPFAGNVVKNAVDSAIELLRDDYPFLDFHIEGEFICSGPWPHIVTSNVCVSWKLNNGAIHK